MWRVFLLGLALLLASTPDAWARRHHHRHHHHRHHAVVAAPACFWGCWGQSGTHTAPQAKEPLGEPRSQTVAHPSGCPRRSFCGCGAAVRVFGAPIRHLWLAANWLRFPRAAPAPGMAAARRHHVFVLERHVSGSTWIVFDANSGRHQTRIHARSIRGFAIVNPRA